MVQTRDPTSTQVRPSKFWRRPGQKISFIVRNTTDRPKTRMKDSQGKLRRISNTKLESAIFSLSVTCYVIRLIRGNVERESYKEKRELLSLVKISLRCYRSALLPFYYGTKHEEDVARATRTLSSYSWQCRNQERKGLLFSLFIPILSMVWEEIRPLP